MTPYKKGFAEGKFLARYLPFILTLGVANLNAQELQTELDEDFLMFLADTFIEDGNIVDQLNMLDLENDAMDTISNAEQDVQQETNINVEQ